MSATPSQCSLIADLLADGRPHSAAEIHQRCGFSRLNSRIADLRRTRHMVITCDDIEGAGRGADAYVYQLVSLLREPSVVADAGMRLLSPADTDGSLNGDPDAAQRSESESLTAAASGAVQGQTGESGEPRLIECGGYVTRSGSETDSQLTLDALGAAA